MWLWSLKWAIGIIIWRSKVEMKNFSDFINEKLYAVTKKFGGITIPRLFSRVARQWDKRDSKGIQKRFIRDSNAIQKAIRKRFESDSKVIHKGLQRRLREKSPKIIVSLHKTGSRKHRRLLIFSSPRRRNTVESLKYPDENNLQGSHAHSKQ